MKEYIRLWSGLESVALPISLHGSGPFPHFGCFDKGFVTLINPCAYKGISIFLELARRLPDVQFAAVPSWGTTNADQAALAQLPNVRLLGPVDNIDEIYSQTRVLLVPSLCAEAKARVVMEAMLHGIPVLASNVGGIQEAKLGIDYLLPVCPIERYEKSLDDRMLPDPVVPDQDIGPWLDALTGLLSDRARYDHLSKDSSTAALAHILSHGITPVEDFLERLAPLPQPGTNEATDRTEEKDRKAADLFRYVDNLSSERRALLALRLGKRWSKDSNAPS